MANPVYARYRGIANVNGKYIRCNDFNVNATQEVLFYKHVLGLNDVLTGGASDPATKGETVGTIGFQNRFWRPSPISIEGSMTFPACGDNSSVNFSDLFGYAKYGNYFDIDFKHYCGVGELYKNCRISNFSFSLTAKDIVNISASILAKDMLDSDTALSANTTAEKIITWDATTISITDPDSGGVTTTYFNGIQFTINNNANNIYTAMPDTSELTTSYKNLLPKDIRLGTQEVTGSLSIFVKEGREFLTALTAVNTPATIDLTCGAFSTKIYVVFRPIQLAGVTGVSIVEVPFVGVEKAFGA